MDLCERLLCQLLFPRARMNFETQPLRQHEREVVKVLRKEWRFDISLTSGITPSADEDHVI